MRIGLFTDAYYPMVDGVIKVVDSYARRLADKCEVTVFAPGFGKETEAHVPYHVERCYTLNFNNFDYSVPMPHFDPLFEAAIIELRTLPRHTRGSNNTLPVQARFRALAETPAYCQLCHDDHHEHLQRLRRVLDCE